MTTNESRRLRRSDDRKIAGVLGGIAEYFDLDPTIVRLAFAILALIGLGGAAVGYVVLWLVMPAPASETTDALPATPQSKFLIALLVVVLTLSLAGSIAWVGVWSLHLLRLSLPVWIIVIVGRI